jgi:hypothetical protein
MNLEATALRVVMPCLVYICCIEAGGPSESHADVAAATPAYVSVGTHAWFDVASTHLLQKDRTTSTWIARQLAAATLQRLRLAQCRVNSTTKKSPLNTCHSLHIKPNTSLLC